MRPQKIGSKNPSFKNKPLFKPLIGFWIGTIILIFAPANFLRFSDPTVASYNRSLISNIINVCRAGLKSAGFVVILLAILRINFKEEYARFFNDNIILIYAIPILIILCFIVYTGERQLCGLSLLSIIILLRYLFTKVSRLQNYIFILLGTFLLIHYVGVYNVREQKYILHQQIINEYITNPLGIVVQPDEFDNMLDGAYMFKSYGAHLPYDYLGSADHRQLANKYYFSGHKPMIVIIPALLNEKNFLSKKNVSSVNSLLYGKNIESYYIMPITNNDNKEYTAYCTSYSPRGGLFRKLYYQFRYNNKPIKYPTIVTNYQNERYVLIKNVGNKVRHVRKIDIYADGELVKENTNSRYRI